MKVMHGHPAGWSPLPGRSAVTIGVFDGVHLGHRSLIRRLDPSLVRTVLTFEPHPVEVLRPGTHPRLLTTLDERIALLEGVGIDQVGVLNLLDIKEFDPSRFVDDVLVEQLTVGQVVCGVDFRFGKDRTGDVTVLGEAGHDRGFIVDTMTLVEDEMGDIMSSSRIRSMIEKGRPHLATEALTTMFRVGGTVIHGDRRGRELGYPTANIEQPDRKVVPAAGVYAGYATVQGVRHKAAINIGTRPTFGEGRFIIEAHLLDFDEDIYGEEISIELAEYFRPELRFDDLNRLVDQIESDIDETRRALN